MEDNLRNPVVRNGILCAVNHARIDNILAVFMNQASVERISDVSFGDMPFLVSKAIRNAGKAEEEILKKGSTIHYPAMAIQSSEGAFGAIQETAISFSDKRTRELKIWSGVMLEKGGGDTEGNVPIGEVQKFYAAASRINRKVICGVRSACAQILRSQNGERFAMKPECRYRIRGLEVSGGPIERLLWDINCGKILKMKTAWEDKALRDSLTKLSIRLGYSAARTSWPLLKPASVKPRDMLHQEWLSVRGAVSDALLCNCIITNYIDALCFSAEGWTDEPENDLPENSSSWQLTGVIAGVFNDF